MLGGGTFIDQNKGLPGAYINFMSTAMAAEGAVKGAVAMPMELDWGLEQEVVKITREEFEKDSLLTLGYPRTAAKMLPFREMFRNASTVYVYRVNSGGSKASNDYAEARSVSYTHLDVYKRQGQS